MALQLPPRDSLDSWNYEQFQGWLSDQDSDTQQAFVDVESSPLNLETYDSVRDIPPSYDDFINIMESLGGYEDLRGLYENTTRPLSSSAAKFGSADAYTQKIDGSERPLVSSSPTDSLTQLELEWLTFLDPFSGTLTDADLQPIFADPNMFEAFVDIHHLEQAFMDAAGVVSCPTTVLYAASPSDAFYETMYATYDTDGHMWAESVAAAPARPNDAPRSLAGYDKAADDGVSRTFYADMNFTFSLDDETFCKWLYDGCLNLGEIFPDGTLHVPLPAYEAALLNGMFNNTPLSSAQVGFMQKLFNGKEIVFDAAGKALTGVRADYQFQAPNAKTKEWVEKFFDLCHNFRQSSQYGVNDGANFLYERAIDYGTDEEGLERLFREIAKAGPAAVAQFKQYVELNFKAVSTTFSAWEMESQRTGQSFEELLASEVSGRTLGRLRMILVTAERGHNYYVGKAYGHLTEDVTNLQLAMAYAATPNEGPSATSGAVPDISKLVELLTNPNNTYFTHAKKIIHDELIKQHPGDPAFTGNLDDAAYVQIIKSMEEKGEGQTLGFVLAQAIHGRMADKISEYASILDLTPAQVEGVDARVLVSLIAATVIENLNESVGTWKKTADIGAFGNAVRYTASLGEGQRRDYFDTAYDNFRSNRDDIISKIKSGGKINNESLKNMNDSMANVYMEFDIFEGQEKSGMAAVDSNASSAEMAAYMTIGSAIAIITAGAGSMVIAGYGAGALAFSAAVAEGATTIAATSTAVTTTFVAGSTAVAAGGGITVTGGGMLIGFGCGTTSETTAKLLTETYLKNEDVNAVEFRDMLMSSAMDSAGAVMSLGVAQGIGVARVGLAARATAEGASALTRTAAGMGAQVLASPIGSGLISNVVISAGNSGLRGFENFGWDDLLVAGVSGVIGGSVKTKWAIPFGKNKGTVVTLIKDQSYTELGFEMGREFTENIAQEQFGFEGKGVSSEVLIQSFSGALIELAGSVGHGGKKDGNRPGTDAHPLTGIIDQAIAANGQPVTTVFSIRVGDQSMKIPVQITRAADGTYHCKVDEALEITPEQKQQLETLMAESLAKAEPRTTIQQTNSRDTTATDVTTVTLEIKPTRIIDAARADPNFEATAAVSGKAVQAVAEAGPTTTREQLREVAMAEATARGKPISSDTAKAIDSMIDVALSLKQHGVIGDGPGQLTSTQLADILSILYINGNPNVRIDATELTHVPQVVEGVLNFLESASGGKATASEKKVAALTALMHDSVKATLDLRTESGYTITQHPFFNKTGRDIHVKPGQSFKEAIAELQASDPTFDTSKLTTPEFLIGVIVHHDGSNVKAFAQELARKGIITDAEATMMWEAVQKHGLVSSWILDNSLAGIGIRSEVFTDPKNARFIELYRKFAKTLNDKTAVEAIEADPAQAAELAELRAEFDRLFTPLEKAMLLGDHQGQIQPDKYLAILGNVGVNKGNADLTAHEIIFGGGKGANFMTDSVMGVILKHMREQQLLSPELAANSSVAFKKAVTWMMMPEGRGGLADAILSDPTARALYDAWTPTEGASKSVSEWLKNIKVNDPASPYNAVKAALEKGFYKFYAPETAGEKPGFAFENPEARAARPSRSTLSPNMTQRSAAFNEHGYIPAAVDALYEQMAATGHEHTASPGPDGTFQIKEGKEHEALTDLAEVELEMTDLDGSHLRTVLARAMAEAHIHNGAPMPSVTDLTYLSGLAHLQPGSPATHTIFGLVGGEHAFVKVTATYDGTRVNYEVTTSENMANVDMSLLARKTGIIDGALDRMTPDQIEAEALGKVAMDAKKADDVTVANEVTKNNLQANYNVVQETAYEVIDSVPTIDEGFLIGELTKNPNANAAAIIANYQCYEVLISKFPKVPHNFQPRAWKLASLGLTPKSIEALGKDVKSKVFDTLKDRADIIETALENGLSIDQLNSGTFLTASGQFLRSLKAINEKLESPNFDAKRTQWYDYLLDNRSDPNFVTFTSLVSYFTENNLSLEPLYAFVTNKSPLPSLSPIAAFPAVLTAFLGVESGSPIGHFLSNASLMTPQRVSALAALEDRFTPKTVRLFLSRPSMVALADLSIDHYQLCVEQSLDAVTAIMTALKDNPSNEVLKSYADELLNKNFDPSYKTLQRDGRGVGHIPNSLVKDKFGEAETQNLAWHKEFQILASQMTDPKNMNRLMVIQGTPEFDPDNLLRPLGALPGQVVEIKTSLYKSSLNYDDLFTQIDKYTNYIFDKPDYVVDYIFSLGKLRQPVSAMSLLDVPNLIKIITKIANNYTRPAITGDALVDVLKRVNINLRDYANPLNTVQINGKDSVTLWDMVQLYGKDAEVRAIKKPTNQAVQGPQAEVPAN